MKKNLEPVRGTSDYLPAEMLVREKVRQTILDTYKSRGFMQVSTPILEDIDNLLSSDGGDNLKLIFKVLKRGEKLDLSKPNLTERDIVDIGLRYDLTVPLVRMYCNNQSKLPMPFKSAQIDYSFRADRPQKGRSRQFIQCDMDILGDPSCNAEIDIITTTAQTFINLGFKNFVCKINDRRVLSDLIAFAGFDAESEKEICICLDKLDKINLDGVVAEMIARGYDQSKTNKLATIISDIKNNGTFALNKYVKNTQAFNSLKYIIDATNKLSNNNYQVVYDVSIIRGQGYYTGAVYEFYLPGFGGACAGGGRYDNMIEKMMGKSIPAVGLGFGFEPTCMLVLEQNKQFIKQDMVAVLYKPQDDFVEVLNFVNSIGVSGSAIVAKKNIGYQLELLKANGYTKFCIFGDNQIKNI